MNKTVETIRSRLHLEESGAHEVSESAPNHESVVDETNQDKVLDASVATEPTQQPEPLAAESLAVERVEQKTPVKADKKTAEAKAVIVTNYPYPKNWIPEGAAEMNEKITLVAEDRVLDARKRTNEPTVITLPTTEKNVSESFADVSVDPVAERISTVIAVNCTNTGDIKSKDGVMIQGVQVGNISIDTEDLDPTGTIVVTKAGTVRGQIEGKRVVVLGRVEGSIKSYTHVTLGESAVVTGDVEYKTIRMMDGAEIEGNCRKLKDEG